MLCADDFGISDGVSRAILDLIAAGRLSATSAVVNGLGGRDLERVLAARGGVGIGLHLNLTAGAPLGAMPSFAPAGRLPPLGRVVAAALARRLPVGEVQAEVERQLAAFAERFGRPPDHVDGHQHVHALPGVRDALLAALAAAGWRPWLRDPGDRWAAILARPQPMKAGLVRALAAGFGTAARGAGFGTNAGFSGFSAFRSGSDWDAAFRSRLRALGPAPVLMCHPGHPDADLARLDPVAAPRAEEFAYLGSEAFAARLAGEGIVLVARPTPFPLSRMGEGQG